MKINELPDELLGLIIQQLPLWRDRVRLEVVCKRWRRVIYKHGWGDVKSFSSEEDEIHGHTSWWGPLLSRVGHRLTTLELHYPDNENDNDETGEGETLSAELVKCPYIKHLSVRWHSLNPSTALDHIRSAYAPALRSLRLVDNGPDSPPAIMQTFCETLAHLTALEFLELECIDGQVDVLRAELRLSAASLPHLRHLTIKAHWNRNGDLLTPSNIEVLTALPSLRSLTLVETHTTANFSFLQRLPHLQHLRLGLSAEKAESFIELLPQMNLRALELSSHLGPTFASVRERLIIAIICHLPQLEHLGTLEDGDEYEVDDAEVIQHLLHSMASLQNLRSLSLGLTPLNAAGWTNLEALSQRLEYLELWCIPPLSNLCVVVGNNRSLLGLKLSNHFLDADSRKALAEAASTAAIKTDNCERNGSADQPSNNQVTLPTLNVGFYVNRFEMKIEPYNRESVGTRLSFVDLDTVRSRALDYYRYGCLSEGRPAFAD